MAIQGDIKMLDPSVSYYEHEDAILTNIVEPLLGYHYLKRPYQLIPVLTEEIPHPVYYDRHGAQLKGDAAAEQVGKAVYEVRLKPGIFYQPHPCFAVNSEGKHIYFETDTAEKLGKTPLEFPHLGTRELVAEDMKVALIRMCDPETACPIYSTLASFIMGFQECSKQLEKLHSPKDYRTIECAGIEITGKYTFNLVLKRKYPQVLYWMAMHFFAPIPWEALAFYNAPNIRKHGISGRLWPVGTGPYYLETCDPSTKLILRANPNFRKEFYPGEDGQEPMPFIHTLYMMFEKESIPGWIKFLQGYYDLNAVPNDAFDTAMSVGADGRMGLSQEFLDKGISLLSSVRLVTYYYAFNMNDKLYGGYSEEQRKLRQAISIMIDSQEFIDIFLNGRGQVAQSFLPPGIIGGEISSDSYNRFVFSWDSAQGKPVRFPLEKARKLMEEAGYPGGIGKDGNPLQLNYDNSSAGNPGFKSQFQWLKAKLALLGIELIDRGTDLNRFRDKMDTGNWQFMRKGWVADYPDPENFLLCFYGKNARVRYLGSNYTNYNNPEFDQLFQKLESLENGNERTRLIQKANQLLQQDCPCVWDLHPTSMNLTHHWLKNYVPHEVGCNNQWKYKRLSLQEREQKLIQWNRGRQK